MKKWIFRFDLWKNESTKDCVIIFVYKVLVLWGRRATAVPLNLGIERKSFSYMEVATIVQSQDKQQSAEIQQLLLDDPDFLGGLVEEVFQQLLHNEVTAHLV